MYGHIVIGTQFGDEGKGRTVDYLSSLYPKNSIVVRFSGGQNCGHTVIRDGVKHIFSSYGSGTLLNVPTYVSEHCTLYLNSVYNERNILINKGFNPKLFVHPLTKLTTPYDVAYNRVMSKITQHGSCGVGISSTMKRHLNTGYKLYVQDLHYPTIFLAKLENIKKYYLELLDNKVLRDRYLNEIGNTEELFISLIDNDLFDITNYNILSGWNQIIFEGSQGIMLDMDHGIFPNVTFTNTTSKNAIEISNKIGLKKININYVTRCYQTRHGNGWMSNQEPIKLINTEEEINVSNFQGEFRTGELDYNILNYSIGVDDLYLKEFNGKIYNKNLVITCLDQRPDFVFDDSKFTPQLFSIMNLPYVKEFRLSINQ